jgi:hypothetical protein
MTPDSTGNPTTEPQAEEKTARTVAELVVREAEQRRELVVHARAHLEL